MQYAFVDVVSEVLSMYFQEYDYPVADEGVLSPSLRKQVESALTPGVAVWIYAPQPGRWVSGVVDDCSLLEERCLFEVRADEAVGSRFLDGYGLSAHSGFHGIDWFIKQSDTPPPAHPLQRFPELHPGTWISWEEDDQTYAGEIVAVNAATQSFEVRLAQEGFQLEGIPVRQTFSFHELSECSVWSDDLSVCSLTSGDRLVLEGVAFAPIAYLEEDDLLGLRSMSATTKGQTILLSLDTLDRSKGAYVQANELADVLIRFPVLENDGDYRVTFDDAGAIRQGRTHFHRSTDTLPAYLEVLIEKSSQELEAEGITPFTDYFHRYSVRPEALIDIQ